MAKMGRPPLPACARRREKIMVCLLEGERARLEAEAKKAGLRLSTFIAKVAVSR